MKKGKKTKPYINKNSVVVMFDIDATMISYNIKNTDPSKLITVGLNKNHKIQVEPIEEHIQRLKNHKASNHFVGVWSGSGWKWAYHILEKLNLLQYVDFISEKMRWTYDDTPLEEWCKRMYLPDSKKYK